MGVYHLDLDETEKSKSIDLRKKMGKNLKLIYKVNRERTTADYYGLYEYCQMDEDDDYLVVPLTSVFINNFIVTKDMPIANVKKSTGDYPVVPYGFQQEVGRSWLRFFECAVGDRPTQCSVKPEIYNRVYTSETVYSDQPTKVECNSSYCPYCGNVNDLVGGHVLVNVCVPREANTGEYVGILPICNMHNNRNDGFMKLKDKMEVPFVSYRIDKREFKQIYKEEKA